MFHLTGNCVITRFDKKRILSKMIKLWYVTRKSLMWNFDTKEARQVTRSPASVLLYYLKYHILEEECFLSDPWIMDSVTAKYSEMTRKDFESGEKWILIDITPPNFVWKDEEQEILRVITVVAFIQWDGFSVSHTRREFGNHMTTVELRITIFTKSGELHARRRSMTIAAFLCVFFYKCDIDFLQIFD